MRERLDAADRDPIAALTQGVFGPLGTIDHPAEVVAALPQAGGTEVGEAALLALEHAPTLALPLIRKGLLADIPMNRSQVAAILALVAKPWSRPLRSEAGMRERLDAADRDPIAALTQGVFGPLGSIDHPAEVLAALPQAGGTEVGEAALLALEHAPALALPLIRKGLLADIPMNRSQVAAILALVAKPWSHRELLRALEASDDQEKTADARAALLESGDKDAQKAVLAWEERNPHENEAGTYLEIGGRRLGPFYTFGEISLKNRALWIRYEMDKLHDRVSKVKDVIPPESPRARAWWQFWGK